MNSWRSPQISRLAGSNNDIISPIAGLDFILSHFKEPIWSRALSTRTTECRQILVNSRSEALARFAQANNLDCRISAYPPNATVNPSALERFQGLGHITPRNLIVMIDLDKLTFKTERALELALTKTLQNIKSVPGYDAEPTIIWSGNGYHVYLVLSSEDIILENIKEFSGLEQISVKFLRFAEWFLSDGKSDKAHNTTVSFNNCMLRIPGSFNSKNNAQVRVVNRQTIPAIPANPSPSIKPLLRDFRRYLIDQQLKEQRERQQQQQQQQQRRTSFYYNGGRCRHDTSSIGWIEKLLQTPLSDYRKYCVWRILSPYLLNVKRLSECETLDAIRQWLLQCDGLRSLDFNIDQRIREALDSARKGYLPIGLEKLKEENQRLCSSLL